MRKNINNLYVLILIFLIQFKSNTQTIHIGATSIWTLTNQKVRMVNSTDDFSSNGLVGIFSYEQILKNQKLSLFATYFGFRGYTWIKYREGSVWDSGGVGFVVGDGHGGVDVRRYDIGVSYNLLNPKKKFYIKPYFALGLQTSKINGREFGANFFKANGPEYFELEPIRVESFNTTQLVPTVGLKTGFILWKRIDIDYTILATYGYKSYQNMYYKYAYKGVPQEEAIFQGKGTGMFFSLNIGYRIFKLK